MTISDITERKRISDTLEATTRDLQRSNAELEQFASIASHDLQEPLRTIRSFATLLQERLGDKLVGKDVEFMGHVVNGTKRMQEMISAILYYSGVGHQDIITAPVDAGAIARAAVAHLENKITKAGTTILIGPMPTVLADAALLLQLMQNLISNGIKFRRLDRPSTIAISSLDQAGEWVLSVTDNGIGIRTQDRERIFKLFQRGHAVAEYPGTGIGLATCRKIVERHHGRLWLESTLDVGTTFFISLPKSSVSVPTG